MQARHNEDTWSLEQVLYQDGGHTDIVRACHLDLSAGTVASCGEDGRVCLWSLSSSPSAPSSLSSSTANSSTAQLKVSHPKSCHDNVHNRMNSPTLRLRLPFFHRPSLSNVQKQRGTLRIDSFGRIQV